MAKRKAAARSDGRRAPSASAGNQARGPRSRARGTGPKAAGTRSKASAGPKRTGGAAVSRVKAAVGPSPHGQSRRGKPPTGAVGKAGRRAATPTGAQRSATRLPKAGKPSAKAEKDRPPLRRMPDEQAPSPAVPSSLNMNRRPSAARTGRAELEERYREHHETGPAMTAGDVDADWQAAYSVGDEAPGGDNPTPGQTVVEDVGRALGIEYQDEEELKAADKIESRDRHRWELDPASSEDYPERTKGGRRRKKLV